MKIKMADSWWATAVYYGTFGTLPMSVADSDITSWRFWAVVLGLGAVYIVGCLEGYSRKRKAGGYFRG